MEVHLGATPFDLDFHPSSSVVAAALISGHLHLYRYAEESVPQRLLKVRAHKTSCRAVRFVEDGRTVLTGSPDCSILATDVETGIAIARLEDAHEGAVNRLIKLADTTVASGDDDGCIKVWDIRQRSCCNIYSAHEDYVSDMCFVPDTMQLLGTSGDGTLSVSSLRKNTVQSRSEFCEDELLSLVVMKNGRKVICGTQTGALLLYSWGHFKDCSDRFLGYQRSVDTLLKLDDDTLISGSEDGVIRLVGILPNRIIQPLAEHSDYPIERLSFSHDRNFIGSISHDQMLKLWSLEELLEGSRKPLEAQVAQFDSDDDGMDVDCQASQSSKEVKKSASKRTLKSVASDEEEQENTVQADFAFFDPKESDFHGVKNLLQYYLDDTLWDLSGFVDLLLAQTTVGSVVKIEGDEDDNIYSVVSAINLDRYKDQQCIIQLKKFILKLCQKADAKNNLELLLQTQAKDVGLLISQRVINLPPQLLPPIYGGLFDEILWATEDEPTEERRKSFLFKFYLIISKIYEIKNSGQSKGLGGEPIVFVKAEDEIFNKISSWSFTFPLCAQTLVPHELRDYNQMGLVMLVSADKIPLFKEELNSLIT